MAAMNNRAGYQLEINFTPFSALLRQRHANRRRERDSGPFSIRPVSEQRFAMNTESQVSDPDPVFPNEIFAEIAAYFEPGSRSLLNLASSSHALYRLLLPRLYRRVDLAKMAIGFDFFERLQRGENPSPSGLAYAEEVDAALPSDVKGLDLVRGRPRKDLAVLSYLLTMCPNMVQLSCDLWLLELCFAPTHSEPEFANLEVLKFVRGTLTSSPCQNPQTYSRNCER